MPTHAHLFSNSPDPIIPILGTSNATDLAFPTHCIFLPQVYINTCRSPFTGTTNPTCIRETTYVQMSIASKQQSLAWSSLRYQRILRTATKWDIFGLCIYQLTTFNKENMMCKREIYELTHKPSILSRIFQQSIITDLCQDP